jgi:hypothetical protein
MGRKKYSKELKARIALDAIKGQETISNSSSIFCSTSTIKLTKPKESSLLFEPYNSVVSDFSIKSSCSFCLLIVSIA